ncbi:hypothetical protein FANTH_6493 [Fusarium anthophilum]|uniref:Uncharacterized protein n=1 Tax=Fusarium anthophilum TaxID=48485 RepID=A0A8H5E5F6_9HYPO|nr:hypothetical protein FANTH_6493 [Fusarium anthophilum]
MSQPPSQPPSQSQVQEAAAQIIRVATTDGPDRFWPEIVPELNLFAGFGEHGYWDFRLEGSANANLMNAMAPCDICPGAMVYHGTKDGIYNAFLTVSFLSNASHVYLEIIDLSPRSDISSRTANLRLRVADTHEYLEPRDYSSTYPLESSGPLVVFLLPYREEREATSRGYKVEKKALVLEAVNGGANRWGCQLGHIKAAQMNGKGQHVFFGPLESN